MNIFWKIGGVLFIIGIAIGAWVYTSRPKVMYFADLKQLAEKSPQEPPIKTRDAAIVIALQRDNMFEGIEKTTKEITHDDWDVSVRRKGDEWRVVVASRWVIPNYQCARTFTIDGKNVGEGYPTNYCMFFK